MSDIKKYRELRRVLKRAPVEETGKISKQIRTLWGQLTQKQRQQLTEEYPDAGTPQEAACSGRTAP